MEKATADFPLETISTAVGSVIVSFVVIEEALTFWVDTIYRAAGGRHIEQQIPVSLGQKAKFIRRCLKSIDDLRIYAAEAETLLGRAQRIADVRNIVAHGVPFEAREMDDDLILSFRRLKPDRRTAGHDILIDHLSVKQMVALGFGCDDVAASCIVVAKKLADQFKE